MQLKIVCAVHMFMTGVDDKGHARNKNTKTQVLPHLWVSVQEGD